MTELRPVRLRVEHLERPLGLDERRPIFSWALEGDGRNRRQTAFRLVAASTPDRAQSLDPDLWDSGLVASSQQVVQWGGQPLASRQLVFWRIGAVDEAGAIGWSALAQFAMGLLDPGDWQARWIAPSPCPPGGLPAPGSTIPDRWAGHLYAGQYRRVGYLRHRFLIDRPVREARLHATARGLFAAFLDGEPVDDRAFAPGWTDYHRRIEVAVADLSGRLTPGPHVLAVLLGEGWYSGHVGFRPKQRGAHYGILPWFLAQLEVRHGDGSLQTIASGPDWRAAGGGIISSDLLMGEVFDGSEEPEGWMLPDFDDSGWQGAMAGPPTPARLVAERGPPIRIVDRRAPVAIDRRSPDRLIVDFGQNLVGRVRVGGDFPAGSELKLRHGEALDKGGELFTGNLRTAKAEDLHVAAGGALDWAPRFTFHGFRYCELTGPVDRIDPNRLVAEVMMSATPLTGHFRCSHPLVNQLFANIGWSQRGNFLSVPTDCPQRDERLGWTGDAQLFVATAARNADVAAFFAKWLVDLVDAQRPDGLFTDVAPLVLFETGGAPAWADAGILIPWEMWRMTADRSFIDRFWRPMQRHLARVAEDNPDGLRRRGVGFNFGDWLSVDEETPRDLVATAYFARIADRMAQMARATGRRSEAATCRRLAARVRAAFCEAFLEPGGRMQGDSQTAYLLALGFGLVPAEARPALAARLAAKIEARGNRLACGFLGVNLLLPVLTATGRPDLAVALLLQEAYPSWGFSIRHGATSIWERWDSWTPEAGFHASGMNSFNHYALGSVGEWLYSGLGGLAFDEDGPPLERLRIAPVIAPEISWAEAAIETARGRIAVRWEQDPGYLSCDVDLPPGMAADVRLPAAGPPDEASDARLLRLVGRQGLAGRIGSGRWAFRIGRRKAGTQG